MSEVHDRLESWKAIAEYLDHNPATVMRWAKERGLPVYVVPGEGQRRRAVYAYKGEIDAWLKKPAPPGLRADERKNEIPREARNDNRPLGELADGGDAARQNDRHNRVQRPEEAQGEIPRSARNDKRSADESPPGVQGDAEPANDVTSRARFLAPLGMTTVTNGSLANGPLANGSLTNGSVINGSLWSWLGRRRSLWAVFVGGALLAAIAAGSWLRLPGPEPKVLGIEQLTNDGVEKHPEVVTDGARVYFTEHTDAGWVVAGVPSAGGNPVAIAQLKSDLTILDLSPGRSELLLIEARKFEPRPIWALPLLGGGELRRLGDILAYSAAWSPGGSTLAYTTDGGLYLSDANGANPRRIVAMPGKLEDVHWSPNGQQLCWRRVSDAEATLWLASRDGKGVRRLAADWDLRNEGRPCSWTPDGKYLVLKGHYAGQSTLWALRVSQGLLNRHEKVTLLGPAGVDLSSAASSPDGSTLYCVGDPRAHFQLERLDAQSRRLVPYLPDLTTTELDFTNDGGWVAYVDEKGSLWKGRVGGGEKVQLTAPTLEVELPRWSPDGKWIAFMGRDPGRPWKVRLVAADGGPYLPVTATGNPEGAPTWSPDGSRLMFGDLADPAARPPGPLVIHIFDLKERRLSVVPGSEGLWTARWSPNGRYIAALTEDSHSLMLFDFQTAKWENLLSLGRILDLHWSRQGKSIFLLASTTKGHLAIFRVMIPSHQAELLIDLEAEHAGNWLGLAPDDSPLVARPVTSGEIYALQCQFPK